VLENLAVGNSLRSYGTKPQQGVPNLVRGAAAASLTFAQAFDVYVCIDGLRRRSYGCSARRCALHDGCITFAQAFDVDGHVAALLGAVRCMDAARCISAARFTNSVMTLTIKPR
jgi:hypothetical protein